jgi:hypothetical protein
MPIPQDAGAFNWQQFIEHMQKNHITFKAENWESWTDYWECWKQAYVCSENLI